MCTQHSFSYVVHLWNGDTTCGCGFCKYVFYIWPPQVHANINDLIRFLNKCIFAVNNVSANIWILGSFTVSKGDDRHKKK